MKFIANKVREEFGMSYYLVQSGDYELNVSIRTNIVERCNEEVIQQIILQELYKHSEVVLR